MAAAHFVPYLCGLCAFGALAQGASNDNAFCPRPMGLDDGWCGVSLIQTGAQLRPNSDPGVLQARPPVSATEAGQQEERSFGDTHIAATLDLRLSSSAPRAVAVSPALHASQTEGAIVPESASAAEALASGVQAEIQSIAENAKASDETDTKTDPVLVDDGSQWLARMYLWSMCVTVGTIAFIYWPRGGLVILRVLVYLFSNATIKLSVQTVFTDFGIEVPRMLTTLHLLTSTCLGFGILFYQKSTTGKPIAVPTSTEFWKVILPLSLGFSYSLGAGNTALVYCSTSFTEMVSATTPVFTVGLMVLIGIPFYMWLLLPTTVVLCGAALAVFGEIVFSPWGLFLCVMSNTGRSIKGVLQQRLMTGELKDKYDPVTLLSWMCLTALPPMVVWGWATEGILPTIQAVSAVKNMWGFFLAVTFSCLNAAVLNASHIFVVKDLGAVGIQVVAQTKSVLTIIGSMALFHDEVTPMQMGGFVLVLGGAWWYSRMDANKPKPLEQESKLDTPRSHLKSHAQASGAEKAVY